jgi:cytochrome c oxidase assembly protein subunit 15
MATVDTAFGRLRGKAVSARAFERSALITLALLWLVVVTGGLVRLTASGLGCTAWPNCEQGHLIPAGSYHALIEYSNRIISGLAVIATVVTAVLAHRTTGTGRAVRRAAYAAAGGTVAQAPLGAVTVASGLNPWAVMSHFLLAMAVVSVATWLAFQAWASGTGRAPAVSAQRHRPLLAWGTVALALVLVTTGAFVTAAGPHPGSADRPIERLGSFYDATYVHVRAATAFSLLVLILAVWLWRTDRGSLAQRLSVVGLALTICQAGVGEYQYRHGLPWTVIVAHVAIAATLVVTAVVLACLVTREVGSPDRG